MKTPRLALLAFLALSASFANASSLPTWTVIEEGPRSWARVFFTVGNQSKTLRCRYHECKPEVKKISNLYTIKPVGTATPTKVTIYKMVPRSKWNPRYYTDGPYEKVPEVINAKAQPYSSELSHFKLDNTGARLVVVQGAVKYPATTDISQAQFNSYDQLKVAPPTKMIDDVVQPDAPATRPETGDRPGTAPAAKWWCDPKTGQKYSAARGRRGSILLASQNAECKKTGAAAPDTVVTPPPAETATSLALIDTDETRWLTKAQVADYARATAAAKDAAARKAADDKYRDFVEAQTRPEAQTAYKAARALPLAEAAEKLTAAVGAVEMWGGKDAKDFTAIVEPFADPATPKQLEIQLSKAEWDALSKKDEDKLTYTSARDWARGASGTPPAFDAKRVDPVALHLSVVAARKALGSTTSPVVTPPTPDGDTAALEPRLTAEELALLTPEELTKYLGQLKAANATPPNQSAIQGLSDLSKRYRAAIKADGRAPYEAPKSSAAFVAMKPWQQAQYCAPSVGAANATTAPAPVDDGHGELALPDLIARAERLAGKGGAGRSSSAPAWANDACKKYYEGAAYTPPDREGSGRGSQTAVVPGPDAVAKEKEGNKWLTKPLITTGIKGGLIGLLLGSLFGPVGLIAGPLIGAALFYGMSKYDEIKAEKAKNKPE